MPALTARSEERSRREETPGGEHDDGVVRIRGKEQGIVRVFVHRPCRP